MPRLGTSSDHQRIAKWFFLLIFAGAGLLFWKVFEPFVIVLITAAIVGILVAPLEHHIRLWTGHPKVSALIMIALVLSAIVLPLATIALLTADQAVQILQDTLANPLWTQSFTLRSLPFFDLLPTILVSQLALIDPAEILRGIATWMVQNIGTIFASSADIVFKTFIFFVSLYFFLLDREKIKAELVLLSPLKHSIDNVVAARLVATVRGVVFG